MINNLGYQKNLFILPFDHRSSFIELLGFINPELSSGEKESITKVKEIIYTAFKKAVEQKIPKNEAAILVDEEYGDKIIKDAISQKYNVILTTEKSEQKEFGFEYEDDFAKHIEKYNPTFVKALIRYNPNDDPLSKMRQQQKLEILSNYCHEKNYKFLLELLIPPVDLQLKEVNGNNDLYDLRVRPNLTARAIEELQNSNIEPDVWKIEGMENEDSYKIVALQAKKEGRNDVGIVILGRAENQDKVEKWIRLGKKINGIIGFAIGRTIFWEPLTDYKNGKIEKEVAINTISNNFLHFYDIFTNKD
jgi:myo-inositol catabolism protein IolC